MKMLLVVSLILSSFAASAVTPATFEESKANMLKSIDQRIAADKDPGFIKAKTCVESAKTEGEIQNCINRIRSNPVKQ